MADSNGTIVDDASFEQGLAALDAWRHASVDQLRQFSTWLRAHDLEDEHIACRLETLVARIRAPRLMVAFIAELGRGKSKLIDAIFFAGMGQRRIMPASAGRTTRCPVEIGYNAHRPPGLRLLPLVTREQSLSLMEWRERRDDPVWVELPLDVSNPARLAATMQRVAETQRISRERAVRLGFWDDERADENPPLGADGRVEVPMWRYALINFRHPLLEKGLVILDTPGLNTLGVEPEIALALLPQAHALMFILAADIGLTRPDLDIWHRYCTGADGGGGDRPRYVLLNRIDTLWNSALDADQNSALLQRQCADCARKLGVPLRQILPVSAQKGLAARLGGDERLLRASRLPEVERVLVGDLLPYRRQLLERALIVGLAALRREIGQRISVLRRELADQLAELRSLHGKNADMVQLMLRRVESERHEFESVVTRVLALHAVLGKQSQNLARRMSRDAIRSDLADLHAAALDRGVRITLGRAFGDAMQALHERAGQAQAASRELGEMLQGSFDWLNTACGFTLALPKCPGIGSLVADLDFIEQRHAHYFSIGHALQLHRPHYAEQLLHTLESRVRSAFDDAQATLEVWSSSAMHALEVQLRERRHGIQRRVEGLEKVQQASDSLDGRIAEIDAQQAGILRLESGLEAQLRALAQVSSIEPVRSLVTGARATV